MGRRWDLSGSAIGELLITALYDGFVPVLADDLHGPPSAEIARLLTEAYMPPEGDPRTGVTAFLVEQNDRRILIDAGSDDSLGPDTGYLAANLAAASIDGDDIDHVLLTHLHPDHAGGLISGDGQAAFSHATVHAAKADADHWLDAAGAARPLGQRGSLEGTGSDRAHNLPTLRPK